MRVNKKTPTAFLVIITELISLIGSSRGKDITPRPALTLPKDYDSTKPPNSNGMPVEVFFKVFVQTVAPIVSSEMEFRVNFRMTMSWLDDRLTLNAQDEDSEEDCPESAIVPREIARQIWIPDPYISNAKYTEIKKFYKELVNMHLFDNHTVQYTMIINATVACAMNFRFYPKDIQLCPMLIQSLSYDDSVVQFKWDSYNAFVVHPTRLIQFFVVTPPPPEEYLDFQPGLDGNFTQLVSTFRFERLIGSHLVQSFIPCSLVVILSWFSFWLGLEGIAARGSLLMISILTLVTHFAGLRLELPPVAYVKAVDIWMFGCIFSIFAAISEFLLVKVVYGIGEEVRRENQVYSMRRSTDDMGLFFRVARPPRDITEGEVVTPFTAFWLWDELRLTISDPTADPVNLRDHHVIDCYKKKRLGSIVLSGRSTATAHLPLVHKMVWRLRIPFIWEVMNEKTLLWREIDRISKFVFPVTFIVFCVAYWATLLIHDALI